MNSPPTAEEFVTWCQLHLGAAPVEVLFEAQHLSFVRGLRLSDGREVVVKARPTSPRIEGGLRVQRYMWQAGYPCPEPLAGPAPLGPLSATAESYLAGGADLEARHDRPRLFAQALVEFVRVAAGFPGLPELRPPLPWVGWDHDEPGLWPAPDDLDVDLNTYKEPVWLDEIGRRVRTRLRRDISPRVIGHGDWWGPNLHWLNGRIHAVFDWDSLAFLSEAAIAGAAAAQFADAWPAVTTLEQTEAFIGAYEVAQGRPWSKDEREVCWAAGLWLMAFNAKKQPLQGVMESLEHLREYGAEKLRRAGA